MYYCRVARGGLERAGGYQISVALDVQAVLLKLYSPNVCSKEMDAHRGAPSDLELWPVFRFFFLEILEITRTRLGSGG